MFFDGFIPKYLWYVTNVIQETSECKIQDVRQQSSSKFPGDLFYEETTSQSVGLNSGSKTRTRPLLVSLTVAGAWLYILSWNPYNAFKKRKFFSKIPWRCTPQILKMSSHPKALFSHIYCIHITYIYQWLVGGPAVPAILNIQTAEQTN